MNNVEDGEMMQGNRSWSALCVMLLIGWRMYLKNKKVNLLRNIQVKR
jgi:hypothetical protein